MLGTMSSGYDSACVAALGHRAGMQCAISFAQCKTGAADSGKAVADVLGLELRLLDRNAYRSEEMPEIPFVASDAKGEDVYFRSAERQLSGAVLLTGFCGDLQWQTHYHHRGPRFVRGDRAGFPFPNIVCAGFIHCPVPYMARCIRISSSPSATLKR